MVVGTAEEEGSWVGLHHFASLLSSRLRCAGNGDPSCIATVGWVLDGLGRSWLDCLMVFSGPLVELAAGELELEASGHKPLSIDWWHLEA